MTIKKPEHYDSLGALRCSRKMNINALTDALRMGRLVLCYDICGFGVNLGIIEKFTVGQNSLEVTVRELGCEYSYTRQEVYLPDADKCPVVVSKEGFCGFLVGVRDDIAEVSVPCRDTPVFCPVTDLTYHTSVNFDGLLKTEEEKKDEA